jgi:hypothetical protein
MNAVVIRERVMPRENGRLDGLAGSMVEYVIVCFTLLLKLDNINNNIIE